MSLIKWEPFTEFDRLFKDMSSVTPMRSQNMNLDLACDVYEDGNNLVAEMNVPGLDGKDIAVEIENRHLHISGTREEVQEKKEKNHYTKEIQRGSFQRVVALPAMVDQENVEAEYKDGVLKVIMPKIKGEANHKVKVKVT